MAGGGTIPKENVVRASDFLLLHGNGVKDPGESDPKNGSAMTAGHAVCFRK